MVVVPLFRTLYAYCFLGKGLKLCTIHPVDECTDPCAESTSVTVELVWASAKVTECQRCAKIKGASLFV